MYSVGYRGIFFLYLLGYTNYVWPVYFTQLSKVLISYLRSNLYSDELDINPLEKSNFSSALRGAFLHAFINWYSLYHHHHHSQSY